MAGLREYLTAGADAVLLAHTPKQRVVPPELLVDHSDLVLEFADKLYVQNGLSAAIHRVLGNLTVDNTPLCPTTRHIIATWFRQAIYLHDIGKMNPAYQRKKMHNQNIEKLVLPGDSTHALLSALLYLDINLTELDSLESLQSNSLDLKQVLYAFAYVISRHHTYLGNLEEMDGEITQFEKQLARLQRDIRKYPAYIHYYRHKERLLPQDSIPLRVGIRDIAGEVSKSKNGRFADTHSPFPFYILTKLLYSTMVACDFYATNAFDTGEKMEFQYFSKEHELAPVLAAFHNTKIYRGIQAFRDNPESVAMNPINKLRSALFIETEKEILLNLEQPLYYLEAPTGSGKTYMSVNLGLQLLNSELGINKLIYVFPFNALIEQTKETLDEIFPADLQSQYRMTVVNSVTPIVTEKELAAGQVNANGKDDSEPDIDYKIELLQRQMLQYPVTLTSHVNFFNYLFGVGRESNLAFTHLCNSVVILDEIQSYKNEIWMEIIHFLRSFAELLNMKIIIMSATLPKLDRLLEGETETCSLVANRDVYFQNPLFRNRVQLHFELLHRGVISEEDLLEEVLKVLAERKAQNKSTRLFVEFITKTTARSFYHRLRSMKLNIPLFELTGDDSNLLRKQVLKQLSKDENGDFYLLDAIVVATQVIEAGVDIDMDIGFKDISILDSEEQFLGRINRSCLRADCHAYFFNMFMATKIYRGDLRTENDLRSVVYQQMLLEKDFAGFYQVVMERINEKRRKANPDNWSYFTSDVQQLQFKEVEEKMRLITEKQYTLFIAHQLTYTTTGGTLEQLDGTQVWEEFKYLLADKELEYAERIVKLSRTKEKMAYFTYSYGIQRNSKMETPANYTEKIGSLFYVPDGERFMELDENTGAKKFNRHAYMEAERSLLL